MHIRCFKSERSMLMAWQQMMVHDLDPDMVVTYEYDTLATLVQRLEALRLPAHAALGRIRGQPASLGGDQPRSKPHGDSQRKNTVSPSLLPSPPAELELGPRLATAQCVYP